MGVLAAVESGWVFHGANVFPVWSQSSRTHMRGRARVRAPPHGSGRPCSSPRNQSGCRGLDPPPSGLRPPTVEGRSRGQSRARQLSRLSPLLSLLAPLPPQPFLSLSRT